MTSLAILSFLNHKGGNTKGKPLLAAVSSFPFVKNVVYIELMERGYLMKLLQ